MSDSRQMIDMFTHIVPDKYSKALYSKAKRSIYGQESVEAHHKAADPALMDIGLRLGMLDKYEGMRQVLTIGLPALESVVDPSDAVELAKVANEEMAELVDKYPERFVAAVACLPMNDVDAALREAQRAIETLNMKGVQIHTPCNEKPLDSPEFFPLYEMMMKYDLPIWIHPTRSLSTPDYKGESESKYDLAGSVGWPYETTLAMMRLVLSGILEKYASLKIITHHCGGMVPYFDRRLGGAGGERERSDELPRPRNEYFKMFYADTAMNPSTAALMCGLAFFGAEHLLFGTDFAYGGEQKVEATITSVEQMAISDSDKHQIFEGNARRLLHI